MANSLINGTEGAMAAPSDEGSDPHAGLTPTWGYHYETAAGKLFHVKPGEAIPEGYVDSPAKCKGRPGDVGSLPAATVPTDPAAVSDAELERLTAPDETTDTPKRRGRPPKVKNDDSP